MQIVELDGVYHEPTEVDMLYLTPAQSMGVLLTTKNDTSQNYAVVTAMDRDLFDTLPDTLVSNATAYFVYDSTKPLPTPTPVSEFNPYDDFDLVPTDHQEVWGPVDTTITLDVVMANLGDGVVSNLLQWQYHSLICLRITPSSTTSRTKHQRWPPCTPRSAPAEIWSRTPQSTERTQTRLS